MKEVTDAELLQKLDAAPALKPVDDPETLRQLDEPGMSVFGTPLPKPPKKVGALESLDDTMRMLASGASFGFADELAAGMNALLGIGTYEENLQKEMARDASIREREPAAALTAEVAGGLGTGVPGAGKVMGAKALQNVPTGLKLAGLGAVGGGIAGAGSAKPGERESGAIFGAGMGAFLGGVGIPLAKKGVDATIRKFMGTGIGKDVRVAAQKILRSLQSDDLTPDEAFVRLAKLGPEGRLVDVGENTRRLGRAVAGEPGKASKIASDMLESRQQGQGARVTEAVNKAIDPTGDFSGAADELQKIRSTAARPLYEKAYKGPVEPSEELVRLFRRPAMQQAWIKAQKIAQNEGDVLPDNLFDVRPDGGKIVNPDALRDVKLLDQIKRGLDDVVEPHRDLITGKIKTNAGRAVDNLRREYVAFVDKLSPDYKAARAAYSGPTRSLEMMDMGRRFARADEEVTARQLARMTGDEKFFFRIGAARQLRDTIYNTPDGADAVKRIFGSQLKRDRLRAVFPDDASFKTFREAMEQESQLYGTRAIVSPRAGSQTQPRQADAADLAGAASDLAQGNTGSAALKFVRRLFGRNAEGLTPEQAETLSKSLFTNDPEINRQIVRALSVQRMLENLEPAFGAAAMESGKQAGAAITR